MATLIVIVTIVTASAVLAALACLVARSLRHASAKASISPEGYQEATIIVNGRYRPDNIRIERGTPVRLHFVRAEDNPCSERVIISGVGLDRRLPAFQSTTVEFIPKSSGTFLFTCHWGMYRGELVVTEPGRKSKAARGVRSGEESSGIATGR